MVPETASGQQLSHSVSGEGSVYALTAAQEVQLWELLCGRDGAAKPAAEQRNGEAAGTGSRIDGDQCRKAAAAQGLAKLLPYLSGHHRLWSQ